MVIVCIITFLWTFDRIFFFLLLHVKQHMHASNHCRKRREIAISKNEILKGIVTTVADNITYELYLHTEGTFRERRKEGKYNHKEGDITFHLTYKHDFMMMMTLIDIEFMILSLFLQNDTQYQPTW